MSSIISKIRLAKNYITSFLVFFSQQSPWGWEERTIQEVETNLRGWATMSDFWGTEQSCSRGGFRRWPKKNKIRGNHFVVLDSHDEVKNKVGEKCRAKSKRDTIQEYERYKKFGKWQEKAISAYFGYHLLIILSRKRRALIESKCQR